MNFNNNNNNNHRQFSSRCMTQAPNLYFMITITNYPYFLIRAEPYHVPPPSPPPLNISAMLIPNRLVHLGTADADMHEALLYNTLKFELEQAIRSYLQQTQRSFPISMIFDMRYIESRFRNRF